MDANRLSFHYDEKCWEMTVFYLPADGGEKILLGVPSNNIAQRSSELYLWAEQRLALLGLTGV